MNSKQFYNGNVLDLEASGLSIQSYAIEVAVVLHDGSIYHSLIRPPSRWTYWSSEAERIHGISRDMLMKCGKSPSQICRELNELCENQDVFSDCWVHDSVWLRKLYEEAQLERSFRLNPVEYFLSEIDFQTWAIEKHRRAMTEGLQLHRAMSDAYVIKCILDEKLLGAQQPSSVVGPILDQTLTGINCYRTLG